MAAKNIKAKSDNTKVNNTKSTSSKADSTKATTAKADSTKATTAKADGAKANNAKKEEPVKKPAIKRALGKGLNSMLGDLDDFEDEDVSEKSKKNSSNANGEGVTLVNITRVEPNKNQPRSYFDEDKIQELSDSIKEHGLIEPIIVQDKGDVYQIIAGERRWRACRKAGLKEIPVIIKHYKTEQEIVEVSLIENIQREDLNPIEEAQAYKRLTDEFGMTQDKVAERVGKSRSEITNSMRLLKLCDDVQQMVIMDMLSKGHVRALLAVENPEKQYELAQKAFDEKLSVREVEKLVKNLDKPAKQKPVTDEQLQLIYSNIQEQLKVSLGTKVAINGKGKGTGSITIEFYNNDDFEKIVERLKNEIKN